MAFATQYYSISKSVIKVVVFNQIGNGKVMLKSIGTGTIINDGSMVLTCAHCVDQRENSGIVFENKFLKCESVIKDNNLDVAILQFDKKIGNSVPLCTASESSNLQIGDDSFVVGYPMNCEEQVLLPSTISSLGVDFIRIASNINHGNSGGPLFNANGVQIGVVNAKHGNLSDLLDKFSRLPAPSITINEVNTYSVSSRLLRISLIKFSEFSTVTAMPGFAMAARSPVIFPLFSVLRQACSKASPKATRRGRESSSPRFFSAPDQA